MAERPTTNPYLLLKDQELRSLLSSYDKTFLEKRIFDEEPDEENPWIPGLEKKKKVVKRDAPKHSTVPVLTAHLEHEVITLT